MTKINTQDIVNIKPLTLISHLTKNILSIVVLMFFTGIISFVITSNESNQTSLLLFYIFMTLVLFSIIVINNLRKPFTYIYSIKTNNDLITIEYNKLFNKETITANVIDLDLKFENYRNKNSYIELKGSSKEGGFCTKQYVISEWNDKLMSEVYNTLKTIIPPKVSY